LRNPGQSELSTYSKIENMNPAIVNGCRVFFFPGCGWERYTMISMISKINMITYFRAIWVKKY
jgi:hypothetical protein